MAMNGSSGHLHSTSAFHPASDVAGVGRESPKLTQAVWKLFFCDRDEILIREVGLRRNNDSPTPPSGFNYCAEALGVRVFTQPGPKPDIEHAANLTTMASWRSVRFRVPSGHRRQRHHPRGGADLVDGHSLLLSHGRRDGRNLSRRHEARDQLGQGRLRSLGRTSCRRLDTGHRCAASLQRLRRR